MRCAASLRDGTVTASLLIARLQAAGGKLPLTRALQEYGRLVTTRFVLGYLADRCSPSTPDVVKQPPF